MHISPASLPDSVTSGTAPWLHDEEGGYASDPDIISSPPHHTAADGDGDYYAAGAALPVEAEEESTMDLRSQLIRSRYFDNEIIMKSALILMISTDCSSIMRRARYNSPLSCATLEDVKAGRRQIL